LIELENFYADNQPLEIALDSQKSPASNAQWYFNRYQNLTCRKKHLASQIPLTQQEMDYNDYILSQLEIASIKDIEENREELSAEEYLRKQRQHKKKKRKKSKPDKYYSTDNTLILIGKNNNQNDQLTMRTANKSDWWLHTKDIPGSHVVIRSENPSSETIEEAAHLAAYHSKFSLTSSDAGEYTQIKHVHKPTGSKPGYVIYYNQLTIFVTPDKKLIKRLKQNVSNNE